jgi:tetratricopeptide (TPR) repeat protein
MINICNDRKRLIRRDTLPLFGFGRKKKTETETTATNFSNQQKITTNPELNSQSWYNKGFDLYNLGRFEEAIEYFNKALELNSEFSNAWTAKGSSLNSLCRFPEAIECFNKALNLNPKDSNAWYNKAQSLESLGHLDESIECFNKVLEINPLDDVTWSNKAGILERLARYEEAIKCSNRALELNLKNVDAWYNKGASLGMLSRFSEAIICYDNALKLNSQDWQSWANKGVSLNRLGRFEEAIECCNRALELNPQNTTAIKSKAFAEETLRNSKKIDGQQKSVVKPNFLEQVQDTSSFNGTWKFCQCYSCGEDLKIAESASCQDAICPHCSSQVNIFLASSKVNSKDSATELKSYVFVYSTELDEEKFSSVDKKTQILRQITDDVHLRFRYYFSGKTKAVIDKSSPTVGLVFETNYISTRSIILLKEYLVCIFKPFESKNAKSHFDE